MIFLDKIVNEIGDDIKDKDKLREWLWNHLKSGQVFYKASKQRSLGDTRIWSCGSPENGPTLHVSTRIRFKTFTAGSEVQADFGLV